MPAKQLKMSLLQVFLEMTTQRNGFGQNSCAADQQACVFGSCECNKHSVLKIFMINPNLYGGGKFAPQAIFWL